MIVCFAVLCGGRMPQTAKSFSPLNHLNSATHYASSTRCGFGS